MRQEIPISKIRTDGLQMRAAMNEHAVAEYGELMRCGTVFPPVTLFHERAKSVYWLADGFHRLEAAKRSGRKTVTSDVHDGEWIDALRYALHANSGHGMRMTNADKRKALRTAWDNRRMLWGRDDADPSAALLAETCGVSIRTAKEFTNSLPPGAFAAPRRPQGNPQPVQIAPVDGGGGSLQPVQIAPVDGGGGSLQPVQIAPVEKPKTEIHAPRRVVFGKDGKTRTIPEPRLDPAPAHVVPVDRYGVEIPVEVQAAFDGADGLKEVLSLLSKARTRLRRAAEAGEAAFAAVRQDALVNADNAYRFVVAAKPHCVCRMCQGIGCKACHGRGWQTEEEYNRNPKEFRE